MEEYHCAFCLIVKVKANVFLVQYCICPVRALP